MKLFISYSRDDAGNFSKHVYKFMRDKGHDVFIDLNSIIIGDPWARSIEKNISNCDIFVVILTPDSLTSSHVEKEVLQAQRENKIIVPCRHEYISYNQIKWGLENIQGIEFSDKFELILNLYQNIANYENILQKQQNNVSINLEQDNLSLIQKSDFDNLIIDEHSLDHYDILKEPSESEIEQIIYEIESSNNEEKEHKFNELEDLARSKRLYNNKKILALCDKYILSNNDYSLLSRVLDFVNRLLSTSTKIDRSNDCLNYVRSKYSEKFREIILSTEKESRDVQYYVRQILEWYEVFDEDNIHKLYWQSIKNHIKVKNLETSEFLQCITPYFNKIKQSVDFKLKCRSEIFEMTKLNDEKVKQRAELLMKLFPN